MVLSLRGTYVTNNPYDLRKQNPIAFSIQKKDKKVNNVKTLPRIWVHFKQTPCTIKFLLLTFMLSEMMKLIPPSHFCQQQFFLKKLN